MLTLPWYWRMPDTATYCDPFLSFKEICRHCPSILLLHGAHLWPNVATLDGRVNLRDVLWNGAVMENTFFQVAKWSTWSRKRPGERDHQLHNKLPIDLSHITSYHWQIMKWHYKLQSTTNFFQQVLESIIGGRIVQVIHQSLDGRSVWLGTTQLLNCQANVLVGSGAAADMAGSAGGDKQTLATNHLLLGQGGGLALLVHLKSEMVSGN